MGVADVEAQRRDGYCGGWQGIAGNGGEGLIV